MTAKHSVDPGLDPETEKELKWNLNKVCSLVRHCTNVNFLVLTSVPC